MLTQSVVSVLANVACKQPCKQCHKRVTGKHVNAVQTRRQTRLRQTDRSASNDYDVRDSHCNDTKPIVPSDPSVYFQNGPSPILCDTAIDSELESLDDVCDNEDEVSEQSPPSRQRKQNSRRQGEARGLLARTAPTAAADLSEWDHPQVREKQLNDPDIGPAVYWVESNARPPWRDVKSCSPALRALWQQYDTLVMLDGVLHRVFYHSNGDVQGYQLILPCTLKYSFLELIHGDLCGHLGEAKCKPHIQNRCWWHGWKKDLKLFIQCCEKCSSYFRGKQPKKGFLHPMVLGSPCERWSMDLTGEFPPSCGYRYIFTAICPFSKYAIAVPIKNKKAQTVAKVIVDKILLQWGFHSKSLQMVA